MAIKSTSTNTNLATSLVSKSERDFTRYHRDPIQHKALTKEQCCPNHPWNLRASFTERKSQGAQHCFQCEMEEILISEKILNKSVFPKDWVIPTIDDVEAVRDHEDFYSKKKSKASSTTVKKKA